MQGTFKFVVDLSDTANEDPTGGTETGGGGPGGAPPDRRRYDHADHGEAKEASRHRRRQGEGRRQGRGEESGRRRRQGEGRRQGRGEESGRRRQDRGQKGRHRRQKGQAREMSGRGRRAAQPGQPERCPGRALPGPADSYTVDSRISLILSRKHRGSIPWAVTALSPATAPSWAPLAQALFTTRGLFAEQLALTPTPWRTEGPFYPDKLPLDTDNDLIIINDSITPAVGEITHLTGRVLDASGSPVRNATVEIWQCDANKVYHHTGDSGQGPTSRTRTSRASAGSPPARPASTASARSSPSPTPAGPAPHIHFKVKKGDRELLTTQMNIAGHPGNEVDGVASGGLSVFERELLQVDFKPVKGSKIGELAAHFEIVLGPYPGRAVDSGRRNSGHVTG